MNDSTEEAKEKEHPEKEGNRRRLEGGPLELSLSPWVNRDTFETIARVSFAWDVEIAEHERRYARSEKVR